MNTISHGLFGLLFYKILNYINPDVFFINFGILIFIFVISNLPDVDIIWAKNLESHHSSFFHYPIFWISLYLFFIIGIKLTSIFVNNFEIGSKIIFVNVFFICILIHLITDYICARTAGVKLFYPFINYEYSLFPLDKSKGDKKFYRQNFYQAISFMKYYYENKKLILFEYGINLIAVSFILI